MPELEPVLALALRVLAGLAIPIGSAYCASKAKLMARPGSPTIEDSSVGFDLLIGAGAFAATILVEALQARVSVISGPAPAGFTGQFILGLTVLAALLFAGYWLASFQRKSYAPTPGVEVVRDQKREQLYELSAAAAVEANRIAGAAFAAAFLIFWQQHWVIDHILNPVFSTR